MHRALHRALGPQGWWPGDGALEISLGAILTQNTAWTNVERALSNLKRAGVLTKNMRRSLEKLHATPLARLAQLIRPSGYFRQKARRLKHFLRHARERHGGDLERWYKRPAGALRRELLSLDGIGPETADSILLYAAGKRTLVVDAYTRRVFARHGFPVRGLPYDELRFFLEARLPRSARLYNEFHALIVRVGKTWCRRRAPRCAACPLSPFTPIHKELVP
jgi:endonuclease-3 related protein